MMDPTTPSKLVERGLALFEELIHEDVGLSNEFALSQAEFFGVHDRPHDSTAILRYLEWFLFERFSDTRGGVLSEKMLDAFLERADSTLSSFAEAITESIASIFEVTRVEQDRGVWLRDVVAGGEYALVEPGTAGGLTQRDLVIGRLYPVGDGLFQTSPSAGCFRNREMLEAIRGDIDAARDGRRGTRRLSQAVLETTFFAEQQPAVRPLVKPEAALDRAAAWLREHSVDEDRWEALLAEMRSVPFDSSAPIPGVEKALVRLSEIELNSDLDMAEARPLLLEAWSSIWCGEHSDVVPRSRIEVCLALAEFDRARAAGADLESVFSRLERDLGLDNSEGSEDAEMAPDFPGVVGAMVEEFLWEEGRAHPKDLLEIELLRKLAVFSEPIGLFEEIGAPHLLKFSSCWILEHGDLKGADEARSVLRVLGDFCRWADENHGLELCSSFGNTLAALQESVPRLAEACRHIERAAHYGTKAPLFEVTKVQSGRVMVQREGLTREFQVPAAIAIQLRPGDWLRVQIGIQGPPRLLGCFPPESAVVLLAAI